MGVIYKLKDEVVHFIIGQRQNNPLFSCRQLAEAVEQQFGLRLSKSSVHDVLKESGVVTPRGRKPKDKFQIPLEKKKQIQVSLSQIELGGQPLVSKPPAIVVSDVSDKLQDDSGESSKAGSYPVPLNLEESSQDGGLEVAKIIYLPQKHLEVKEGAKSQEDKGLPLEKGATYDGAGKIFLKAALWDLGIFSEDNIKEEDWNYYLIYTSGIKVFLENDKDYVIDWCMPLHRSIREVADSLINNINPLVVQKVSDDNLFKSSMEAISGFKIEKISLVDENNHIMCEFSNIMGFKRNFMSNIRLFVESNDVNWKDRAKKLFFSQIIDNNKVMENILNLKGFDAKNKEEFVVTISIEDNYVNKDVLSQAIERINNMFLRDEQNRLLKVRII